MTKKISVVMSVYNAKKYLAEAIESILNQTYSNFEFIIINDGSTDSSLKVIQQYAQKDQRIICISRENKGLVFSLNEGITRAKGQYIARMDADDISLPERFETQLAWLDTTGADICGSNILIFGDCRPTNTKYYTEDQDIKCQLLFVNPFSHTTVMGKSHLFKKTLYREDYRHCEDYRIWVDMALSGVSMTNCPEVLLKYRIHNNQVTQVQQQEMQKKHNEIALYYWKQLNMDLGDIDDVGNIKKSKDLKKMLLLLSANNKLNENTIYRIYVSSVKSCDLGLNLWIEFLKIPQIKFYSFKSISLFFLCVLKNKNLPLIIRKILKSY